MVETEAVSPEDKQRNDMILLGCIAAGTLAVFGKFGLDLIGIAKDRKRRASWNYDYHMNQPPEQPPKT